MTESYIIEAFVPWPMRDPICGKTVEPSTPWFIDRDGGRVHFCSLSCALRFNGMPGHELPALDVTLGDARAAADPLPSGKGEAV